MSAEVKPEKETNPWAEYERRKQELPKDLSPADREIECRRIADELGV